MSTPPSIHRGAWWRRHMLIIILIVMTGVGVGTAVATIQSRQAQLDRDQATLTHLETQHQADQANANAQVRNTIRDVLGIDSDRMARDQDAITQFVTTALTWNSAAEYSQARTTLLRTHKLPDTSPFFTTFMPPARYNSDTTGKRYYDIDARHLSSTLADQPIISTVMRVRAATYTYSVLVDIRARSAQDTQEKVAESTIIMTVTTNSPGVITDVSAQPSDGPTRHSA